MTLRNPKEKRVGKGQVLAAIGHDCHSLLTPVAGLIFETKNREIFLERFFWREITAREQVSRAVILEKL